MSNQITFDTVKIGDVIAESEKRDPRSNGPKIFQYVDIASVCNQRFLIAAPKTIQSKDAPSRARKVIRTNDVVFATTRPYLKSIAVVPEQLNSQICSTGFCVLRPTEKILPEWLFYCSISDLVLGQITPLMRGANYPAVTDKDIFSALIPLPPLPEQRRIIARIKECMERVEELEGLRAESQNERDFLLESLIEAALMQADGEPVCLANVCAISSKLIDPCGSQYQKLLHVGGANIESKTGQLINLKTAREEKLISSKFIFDESMILYNKIRPYLMKLARPGFSGLCSADMYPLSPDPERMTRDYLFYLLLSRGFTRYATDGSNRAGMPKVNRKHLFAFEFQIPSIVDQTRITNELDAAFSAVEELRQEMNCAKDETASLRESILNKAFAGEL